MSSSDLTPVGLLKKLLLELRVMSIAHARLADRYAFRSKLTEYPMLVFSVVTAGTAAFGLDDCSQTGRVLVAVGAIASSILAGSQRICGFREAAECHEKLQHEYVNLLREVEGFLAIHKPSQVDSYATFTNAVISRMREFDSREHASIDIQMRKEIEHSITNGDKLKLRMYLLDKVASTQGTKFDFEVVKTLDHMEVEKIRDIMTGLSSESPQRFPLPSNIFMMDRDQLITFICLQWRLSRHELNIACLNTVRSHGRQTVTQVSQEVKEPDVVIQLTSTTPASS